MSKSWPSRILVLRCQTGDEAAFAKIVAQFQPRLSYFVRKMLADTHEIDDVLRSVWLDVFRRIGSLRNPAAFSTWAYRIARDHVYRLHRKPRLQTTELNDGDAALRMNMRRFTRLTNGHSKSLRHHEAMQALLFAWYNFCRKHSTLKTTPALAAKVANRIFTLEELLDEAA